MNKKPIIVIGAGGHAKQCIDVIEDEGIFLIVGLIGRQADVGKTILSYSVIGTDDELNNIKKECAHAIIGIGQIYEPKIRSNLYQKLRDLGFILPNIISPKSSISKYAKLNSGIIVMNGAVINAGAMIESNCIVNSQALIEHDVVIEKNCHISTGVILNGSVKIGEGSFVGSGSIIREGVTVAPNSFIQMGSLIKNDFSGKEV
jgi:sugar O-acyltransferase (sialic acid O-acetyltransferase NeuD family)